MNSYQTIKLLILIILAGIAGTGCKPRKIPKREIISFKDLNGIQYTEVYRRLSNGLGFNEYGYEMEPQWKLSFISDDSARIYSPVKKAFINFPLSRGYDSIFNTARTWYKVRKMNKDSLVFEILKFSGDTIDLKGNKVFMTFYANNYIKNVLHTDSTMLRRHSQRDTLYIKSLIAKSQANINNSFAARQPVSMVSKSPLVTVVKQVTEPDMMNHFDVSDDYMDPIFYININKAYADFTYSFTVYVDKKGNMQYGKPLVGFMEKQVQIDYIRLSKAVMNTYLKYYLQIKPGSTLGLMHSSLISLHVKGKSGR